jgi:hypothetical protein
MRAANCAIGQEALQTLLANYSTKPTPEVVDSLSGLASDMLLAVMSVGPRAVRSARSQIAGIANPGTRRDLVDASAHAIAASLSHGLSSQQLGVVLEKLRALKTSLLESTGDRANVGELPGAKSAFQQLLAKRAA